jgi:hypothetical protein
VTFPLGSPPAGFAHCSFPNRAGVFFVGATQQPQVFLSQAGATGYSVRDYYGNVISSGSVSGTTVTPTAPSGGWKPGWYRVYLTGPTNDPTYGNSLGGTSFVVIRQDARFPVPALNDSNGQGIGGDLPMKAQIGSTTRLKLGDAADPLTTQYDGSSLPQVSSDVDYIIANWSGPTWADPVRTRDPWVAFEGQTWDRVALPGSGGTGFYLVVYPKDETVDGSKVFVTLAAGSSSGSKVTISYPNSSTPVETYDNLGNGPVAATTISNASAYVKAFYPGGGANPIGGTQATTVIGRAHGDGVSLVVSTLYPRVKHFEGPDNEPSPNAETAHLTRLFAGSVKAGNTNAKVIGPCVVSINDTVSLGNFFAAGGGTYLDEITFHDYNSMANGMGYSAKGRAAAFVALLAQYGLSGKRMWQTEAGAAFTAVYGVHHPRRARVKAVHTLVWEQYGIPRERNVYWYDRHAGFWAFPMWMMAGDRSLTPEFVVQRVLAEETYGMTHQSALSFGALGDKIFIGSVFAGSTSKCVELIAYSYMPGATVTLTVTGATGAVTLIDGLGNSSTATITGGRLVVPVQDIPTYVRLPVGASVSVYSVNDWPPVSNPTLGYSTAKFAHATPPAAEEAEHLMALEGLAARCPPRPHLRATRLRLAGQLPHQGSRAHDRGRQQRPRPTRPDSRPPT